MTSTWWRVPSLSSMPSGVTRRIASRHQRDVVAQQHVEDAVVPVDQDRPGGHRRRLRGHLLQQVGTVAELGLEERDPQVPDLLVDRR